MSKRGWWKKSLAALFAATLLAVPCQAESAEDQGSGSLAGSLTLTMGEPLTSLLTETAGTDLTWLNQVRVSFLLDSSESVSVENEADGLPEVSASARIDLNGEDFLTLHALLELEEGSVYVLIPDLRPEAMLLKGGEIASEMEGDAVSGDEITSKAQDLFDSISAEEIEDFVESFSEIVSSGITVSSSSGTAEVGTVTKELTESIFSISGERMNEAVKELLQRLPEDAFVQKVLNSAFAKAIASSLGLEGDEDALPDLFRDLSGKAEDLSGEDTPGFRFTVGTDEEGQVRAFAVVMIQDDAEADLFDCVNLSEDGQMRAVLSLGGGLKALLGLDAEKETMISVNGLYAEKDEKILFSGTIDLILDDETLARIMVSENQVQILSDGKLYLTAELSDETSLEAAKISTENAIAVSDMEAFGDYLSGGAIETLAGRLLALQGEE